MGEPIMFDEPLQFEVAKGCQRFMNVDKQFWAKTLKVEANVHDNQSVYIMTMGADEIERVLSGEQQYILRSQRIRKCGRVHLAVKSLGYRIPGTVEFESQLEFKNYRKIRSWDGLKLCDPADAETSSTIMQRLKQEKSVFAVKISRPQRLHTLLEWTSNVPRFDWAPSFAKGSIYIQCLYTPVYIHMQLSCDFFQDTWWIQ